MSQQSTTPAGEGEGINASDTPYSSASIETALLHGLLAYPARLVCELVAGLERKDFADDDHYEICALIAANAREVAQQAPEDHLDPARVQAQLRGAGKLTESMAHKLLAVASTGRPPVSPVEVGELIAALRLERTRRAMRIAADGLHAAAGNGSTTDMAKAIADAAYLTVLADRAGVSMARLRAVDAVKGVA
ncbi:hypothetical protein ACPV6E_06095 [Corynebacterium propinquum]|uniref:hypothetical protein n=1 Tax=Corynebacterium propinquum TaxID=43769 RepID=UPI003CBE8DC6